MSDMDRIRAALTLQRVEEDKKILNNLIAKLKQKPMAIAEKHNSTSEDKSQRENEEIKILNKLKDILKHMNKNDAYDYLLHIDITNSLVSTEAIAQMVDISIDLDNYVHKKTGGRKRKRSTKRKKRRGKNTRKYRRKY